VAASRASASGWPRRTLQPPIGIPLTARKRAIQLDGDGNAVSPSASCTAIQQNPLACASATGTRIDPTPLACPCSAATSGSMSYRCTMNPPAELHDIAIGVGGGG